jgi:putative zinc finger/helix-turn-helix YgiT family protein
MRAYCHACEADTECRVERRDEVYPVKGEPIAVSAEVMVCDTCGTDLFNAELDNRNLELAFREYRQRKGLLGAEDIIRIRGKYDLSQRSLATLLGWSPATVARYEMGAIPSVPHSEQLSRLDEDMAYVRGLAEAKANQLGQLAKRKLEARLGQLGDRPERLLEAYLIAQHSTSDDMLCGRSEFDLDKAANMISFFARNISGVPKSMLLKLLWYADFLSFGRMQKSISGMVYCHNHYGPIPVAHDSLLEYMQSVGIIDLKPDASGMGEYVEAMVALRDDLFTEEEREVLNDVCARICRCTARRMKTISHKEDGYIGTQMKEAIPYSYGLTLKAIQ